jgi:antibiotic biosynthesis monooxygenase (ABM) superfamily enzyme
MSSLTEPITIAVTRTVAPDRAREAAAWARSGQNLISSYPGYLGSGWIRPDPQSSVWHMLFRFADSASLDAWEKSPERAWWVSTGHGLVEHGDYEKRTGIEGWFDEPSSVQVISSHAATPPRWKQMVSIFLVFYPLSVGANYALSPFAGALPIWLRVLISVLVLTPVMTYLALPFVTRALRPWLLRERQPRRQSSLP